MQTIDWQNITITGGTLHSLPGGGHRFRSPNRAIPATVSVDGPTELMIDEGDLPEMRLRASGGGKIALNAVACYVAAIFIEAVDETSAIELRGNVRLENGRLNGLHVLPGKTGGPSFHVVCGVPKDVKVETLPDCRGLRFTGA